MELMNDTPQILDIIKKYQIVFDRDPKSKIFAPLAEAYRKSGRLEQALRVAQQGVDDHPEFASGLVTLARILIDLNKTIEAITHLKLATEMSPDNFLAHKLLGESYIKLKEPTKALQVFKMALYLDPLDDFAKKMVKKLESVSAADFKDNEVFTPALSPFLKFENQPQPTAPPKPIAMVKKTFNHELDRFISLIDAYLARNDYARASSTLTEALDKLGKTPELHRRQVFLSKRFEDSSQKMSEIDTIANLQLKLLNKLLIQVEDRKVL